MPPTPLTYTVIITDYDEGKGQIKFSHPINMVWLEENFYDLFAIYKVKEEKPDVNYVLTDFKADKFDSDSDGMVVDFTATGLAAEGEALTMAIKMDQEVFSKQGSLFVLTPTHLSFRLTTDPVSYPDPTADDDKKDDDTCTICITESDGKKEVDDNDWRVGLFIFVGLLIFFTVSCFLCCAFCPCCNRKQREDKVIIDEEKTKLATNDS